MGKTTWASSTGAGVWEKHLALWGRSSWDRFGGGGAAGREAEEFELVPKMSEVCRR